MKKLLAFAILGLSAFSIGDYDFDSNGPSGWTSTYNEFYGSGGKESGFGIAEDGGNPGYYWGLGIQWNAGDWDSRAGLGDQWNLDPTPNDWITSIDLSADIWTNVAERDTALILKQGTKSFYATLSNVGGPAGQWLTRSDSYVQNDFVELLPAFGLSDPHSHPDFSGNGEAISMYFGLVLNATGAPRTGAEELDMDNVFIHVNTVPEPMSMIAMATGVGALIARRRKRKS